MNRNDYFQISTNRLPFVLLVQLVLLVGTVNGQVNRWGPEQGRFYGINLLDTTISNIYPIGSGIVWAFDENSLFVVTASHLVTSSNNLVVERSRVLSYESSLGKIKSVHHFDNHDLALLEIECSSCHLDYEHQISEPSISMGLHIFPSDLYVLGCPDGACEARAEKVNRVGFESGIEEGIFRLRSPFIRPGVSGGMVVDGTGRMVGMVFDRIGVLLSVYDIDYLAYVVEPKFRNIPNIRFLHPDQSSLPFFVEIAGSGLPLYYRNNNGTPFPPFFEVASGMLFGRSEFLFYAGWRTLNGSTNFPAWFDAQAYYGYRNYGVGINRYFFRFSTLKHSRKIAIGAGFKLGSMVSDVLLPAHEQVVDVGSGEYVDSVTFATTTFSTSLRSFGLVLKTISTFSVNFVASLTYNSAKLPYRAIIYPDRSIEVKELRRPFVQLNLGIRLGN